MKILTLAVLMGFLIIGTGCNRNSNNQQQSNGTSHNQNNNNTALNDNFIQAGGLNHTMSDDVNDMMKDVDDYIFTGDVDYDNANLLYLMNVGGINMINSYLLKAKDSDVKTFAQKMLKDHEGEIDELQRYIDTKKSTAGGNKQSSDVFQKKAIDAINVVKVLQSNDSDADKLFIKHLIPHHQAGVNLLNAYLESGKDKKLREISTKTLSDYKTEIAEMQKFISQ